MKIEDFFEERIECINFSSGHFTQIEVDEIKKQVIDDLVTIYGNVISPKRKSPLISIDEACDYINVGKTKMKRLVKEGKITSYKMDGSVFFKYDDLDEYIDSCKKPMKVICFKNSIYIDTKSHDVLLFENCQLYNILKENKIWIYLINKRVVRLSKKEFRLYFKNAEEIHIQVDKFNLNPSIFSNPR